MEKGYSTNDAKKKYESLYLQTLGICVKSKPIKFIEYNKREKPNLC